MTARVLLLALVAVGPLPLAAQQRTLAGVVRRALEVHPSVEAASATADAASAGVTGASAAWLPALSLEGSAIRFEEPMLVAPIHAFDVASVPGFARTLLQGSADLGYTLFDGGRRGAGVARARALEGAAGHELAEARAALVQRTAEAYLALLTARDVLGAQEALEQALEAERARVGRLLDEGAAPRLELLRAEAELAAVRASGERARQGVRMAAATLALILDEPASMLSGAALAEPELPSPWAAGSENDAGTADTGTGGVGAPLTDPFVDAGSGSAAAAPPPALAAALGRAAAAEAEAAEARGAWLPELRATAGYALYAGADATTTGEWRGGVRVSYPVFTGGARAAAVDAARAGARAARARAEVVRERLSLDAARARTAEAEARARLAALSAARDSFEELVRVERLALDEGSGVQSDWLRARAGLFEATTGLARARREVLTARLAWARAAGVLEPAWIENLTGRRP